jgi:UDP:flavonoid glycosyltransferase YjiC (YdhE family)
VNIAGFSFLPLASKYRPPPELVSFLQSGSPPVYIGFGSIVVDDPQMLAATIIDATRIAGVRALVSRGWSDLGEMMATPPNVFMLGDCPHDWLFKHVSCVVHHGGAGTTAAGIAAGKPSVVVPFFGDQPFWGDMVAQAGAGPQPIPYNLLTSANLAAAITDALAPTILENARSLSNKISAEQGSETAARSFLGQLPLRSIRCSLTPRRSAVWRYEQGEVKISAFAAITLKREGLIRLNDLELSVHGL